MSSTEISRSSAAERRAAILARAGIRNTRPAQIPGGDNSELIDVEVRELLADEARDFDLATVKGSPMALGMLLQMSIADPDTHELIFEPTDRESLQKIGVASLNATLKLIQEMNGLKDEDIEKAKQLLSNGQSTG